ncbi:hypothetical protein [Nonomuraea sp. NPDC049646]|uniref:hypothetical protein n=1 Tax=unclassified Nonomuraea TaxID=2593643 RepID=UPI0037B8CC03
MVDFGVVCEESQHERFGVADSESAVDPQPFGGDLLFELDAAPVEGDQLAPLSAAASCGGAKGPADGDRDEGCGDGGGGQ